jgi:hypothetical protein
MAARYTFAPKCDLSRPSDYIVRIASIAGISGSTEDLRAQSGKPRQCPQLVTLIGTTAAADAVMTTEDDESLTISVPANAVLVLTRPIKTLVKSGSGAVQVVCEYWKSNNADLKDNV